MVAFRLFVRPALERLLGRPRRFLARRRAASGSPRRSAPAGAATASCRRASSTRADGARVRPLAGAGSHDLVAFGAADRLLRVRADEPAREAGDPIEAIVWD